MAADRRAIARDRTDNKRFAIDRMLQRATHAHILQRTALVVHGQNGLALGGALQHREAIVVFKLCEHFGRAQVRHVVEVARKQRCGLRRRIADEAELRGLDLDIGGVPIAVIFSEIDAVALGPFDELVGTCADWVGQRAGIALLIEDHGFRLAELKRQQRIGARHGDHDRGRIGRGNAQEALKERLELVGALRAGVPRVLRHDIGRIEIRAVVICHALFEMKGIDRAATRNIPRFGEQRVHAAAFVEACQPFEDIVAGDLADRGSRARGGVEAGCWLKPHADGDAVFRNGRSAQAADHAKR